MTTDHLDQAISEHYAKVFRWLIVGSAMLAVSFGISAAVWPEYAKPLLIVPAVMGGVAGLAIGWVVTPDFNVAAQREARSEFWLRLKEKQESNVNQLDLFEAMVPDPAARRKVYKIVTDKGDIRVLHVERFLELLVSRTMEDAGKATDHAMAVAWRKCCADVAPELQPVLGKIFRETFKSDVNGNVIRLLSNVGNNIIAELVPTAETLNEPDHPFKLEAIKPPKSKRKAPGKSSTM